MPSETGIWSEEEAATGHDFSYKLAQWMGQYFPVNEFLVDIGCGRAEYLRYLHDIKFQNLYGVEGSDIQFEFGKVKIQDLTTKFQLHDNGNVICLEVGEHIPEQYLNVFIDNLVCNLGTGCKLLLSWAIPNQDGLGHVSCRHNIWVINEMEKRGLRFLAEDSLKARAIIEDRLSYFRNTILIFQS